MMKIRYVHTNIIAEDWQRLATFYQKVFGCKFLPPERDQKGRWLDKGTGLPDAHLRGAHLLLPGYEGDDGPTLEIFQYDRMEDKSLPAANRKGYGHIAFRVEDVESLRKSILSNGGSDLGEISRTTVKDVGELTFVYMKDPEGNIIELQNWS